MANEIITTERFLIRPLIAADVTGIFELDSNANVHTFLGKQPIKTMDEAAKTVAFIQKQYEDFGIGRWAVVDKHSKEFIGWTGFKFINEPINKHLNYYDLGYRLLERHWGKGIATETAKACVKYGFEILGFKEIFGICDSGNSASKKILQKCGLKLLDTFMYQGTPHYWFRLGWEDWKNSVT
jgi:RimJ/RimL family protein N-acetyltransferase